VAEVILLSVEQARELSKIADVRVQETLKLVDHAIRTMCEVGKTTTNLSGLHEEFSVVKDAYDQVRPNPSQFALKVMDEIKKRGFDVTFKKDGQTWDSVPRLFGAGEGRAEEWKQLWSIFVSW
jgi:hypothetical protein